MARLVESWPRRTIKAAVKRTPYRVSRRYGLDLSEETVAVMRRVAPYTMLSPDRLAETIRATEYVAAEEIPGAIVECGVWRGGTMMAVALTLARSAAERPLYLFDTFEGMSEPTDRDRMQGHDVRPLWESMREGDSNALARASIEEVRAAMQSTGYERGLIELVKGKVEDTLPDRAPDQIALLRLDTDFYESTRHELVHLFPRLSTGGILIIDDYGTLEGAREAADEYFAGHDVRIFLARTDETGRVGVKQA